jgi:hypothetical protein
MAKTFTVVAKDGTIREFYCALRAAAYAAKVSGTVNGRTV